MATYGVDVLDAKVSLRRIHVLARRLPPGALPRIPEASWSVEAHLLARLNDVTELLAWVTARANGSKATQPKPLPRPGGETVKPARLSWADAMKALNKEGALNGRRI